MQSRQVSPFIFFKMAILSLKRHPIRSCLALLGIVIGIAAMTVTMALGEGAHERLQQEILAMGENWVYIYPGNYLSKGDVKRTKKKKEQPIRYEDYLAIRQFSKEIEACTPCVENREIVKYQGNQLVAEIQGMNSDFFKIEQRGLRLGSPFYSFHDEAALPVAVLGSDVAKELFPKENPLRKVILIDRHPFTVIGVFHEAPKRINRVHNPNLNIVVPFSAVWQKVIQIEENHAIEDILLRPKSDQTASQLLGGIRRLLRFRHHLNDEEPDDFTIWDRQAMMEVAQRTSHLFNQFLLTAASVSLIVGGIGVMNIMLVAMTERKKEIGLKMAIGANSFHILSQFLTESILLCLAGGVLGLLVGIGSTYIAGLFIDFDWAIRVKPVLAAFGTTFLVGLFFGFYPAYKASLLHPIEALQST